MNDDQEQGWKDGTLFGGICMALFLLAVIIMALLNSGCTCVIYVGYQDEPILAIPRNVATDVSPKAEAKGADSINIEGNEVDGSMLPQ